MKSKKTIRKLIYFVIFLTPLFAEKILALTGANQKIIYHNLPVDDPKQHQPDITLAKSF